jgi:hypothetical protein
MQYGGYSEENPSCVRGARYGDGSWMIVAWGDRIAGSWMVLWLVPAILDSSPPAAFVAAFSCMGSWELLALKANDAAVLRARSVLLLKGGAVVGQWWGSSEQV